MNETPIIISTKDLTNISDMFEWNFISSKKAYHYSKEITNEEIKKELESIAKRHKDNCQTLLNILE